MTRRDAREFWQILHILRLQFLLHHIGRIRYTQPVRAAAHRKHSAQIARGQFLGTGGLAFRLAAQRGFDARHGGSDLLRAFLLPTERRLHFGLRRGCNAALIFRLGALRLHGFRLHTRKGAKQFAKTFRQ